MTYWSGDQPHPHLTRLPHPIPPPGFLGAWGNESVPGAADIPWREESGCRAGVAEVAEVAEWVTSCCRSVPRAWWMKTPSN